jgi:O-methyltransferase involved in polyketide biosynthesis
MGIRSATFDQWVNQKMAENPNAIVIHLGCGLDSRVKRVDSKNTWFDVDFLQVISERKKYYNESENYKMICADITDSSYLESLPKGGEAIVVMEGVSMYLTPESLKALTVAISKHFCKVFMLMDCYSELAAKLSKYKNPINNVGVFKAYGLDDPTKLNANGFVFKGELDITAKKYINELKGLERAIFKKLYAGNFSKKLYKLYEFEK